MAMLNEVSPILQSRNLDHTITFYDRLGFQMKSRYDDYLILSRDGTSLHFTLNPALDPDKNACACYLYVRGVEALYELWLQAGAIHPNGALQKTEYGMHEFTALDEDKNLLRVGEKNVANPT
ncbi:MAG: VOC family protein [Cytophagaceae bacterium]|nr:VOC family protein [Cytophagaceae bacterium]